MRVLFGERVPLVDGDDDGAPGLDRVARDVRVERRHAFDRVHHDDRHVRPLQTPPRHHDRELLGHLCGLALAPDARRVNEAETLAVTLQERVNGVARRARDGRDDDALLADEPVQERRLPRVRSPDNRQPHLATPRGVLFDSPSEFFTRREMSDERVEQLGHAVAHLRRDRQHVAEAEAVELARVRFEL